MWAWADMVLVTLMAATAVSWYISMGMAMVHAALL